jgi:Zn-dependent protease
MILSLTVHEFAHAWSAFKLGDDTAAREGRMTLNPLSHIDPIGTVVMPLFLIFSGLGWMFGWASAPYDPHWAVRYPKRSGLMALAGPL